MVGGIGEQMTKPLQPSTMWHTPNPLPPTAEGPTLSGNDLWSGPHDGHGWGKMLMSFGLELQGEFSPPSDHSICPAFVGSITIKDNFLTNFEARINHAIKVSLLGLGHTS